MKSRSFAATLCAAMLCTAVACSSDAEPTAKPNVPQSVAPSATATSESPEGTEGVVIDVRIEDGEVTPTNERIEAVVGEPITVRVDSDTADELHVHSVPDHSFDIDVASGQSFEFAVDVPGTVALELHHAGKTVATLLVRP